MGLSGNSGYISQLQPNVPTRVLVPKPKPWVVAIHSHDKLVGVPAYRWWLPFQAMQSRGYVADSAFYGAVVSMPRKGQVNFLSRYDLIVLYGVMLKSDFLDSWHGIDRKIVVDMDDDYRDVHRSTNKPEDTDKMWRQAKRADALTVSTPKLARMVKDYLKKEHVYVVPNLIDVGMWEGWERAPETTIGLTGSFSHKDDWKIVPDAIDRVLAKKSDLHFLLSGYVPEYMEGLKDKWGDRVHIGRKWLPYNLYPGIIAKIDVGLCPVDPDDGFNDFKTPIKALELMASGGVAVCSRAPIYEEIIEDGENGILVDHTPEGLEDGIYRALGNREKIVSNGRKYVNEYHGLSTRWIEWRKVHDAIYQL